MGLSDVMNEMKDLGLMPFFFLSFFTVWKCSAASENVHENEFIKRRVGIENAGGRRGQQRHNTGCCTAAKIYTANRSRYTTAGAAQNGACKEGDD